MWKMFDDIIECNECGGPLGPPPKFTVPPPPRPPSMAAYEASTNCNEEEMALKAQQAWDNDMCEAMPILDASFYSSQSLQTSAMIAVFSLLLVLVVLISSLFVWKNKRKVQNLLPCKTPTRGPHITGALSALASGHSVTYEDPDAHLGHHRPLVMRHHHNVEMLHSKGIHYPSGYPMTRSPPFLVSNSPGPDPYRSNDNVYEELGPSHDSDGESEPPMHSDDDFAEDELSLPGERSFNKSTDTNNATSAVTSAFPDKTEPNVASSGNGPERNSVLSSASSTQDASTATAASSSSSHNNNSNANNGNVCATTTTSRGGAAALLSGMLRHTTGRKTSTNGARSKNDRRIPPTEDLNTSTSTAEVGDLTPMQQMYDNSSNLMALGYQQHQQQQPALNYPHPQSYHHSLHHMHNHNNNRNTNAHPVPHFYNTIESEVERRNRINAQLKNSSNPAVATIFRERIQYPGSARYQQHYYAGNAPNGLLAASMRARTNPRSMDRRRGRVGAPLDPVEPAYGYTEPVYHQNYHYESCNTPNGMQQRIPQHMTAYPTYIMPEYSSGSISSYRQHQHHHPHHHHPASQTYQNSSSLYGHGDSSFGSDSGYSHHTPASSIGRHDYDIAMPIPPAPPAPTQKPPSKLANALSFSWNKKKSSNTNSMNMQPNTNKTPALSTSTATEASSPNNNSGASTITSTLENTSSSSSGGLQSQNNNELVQA
ncbi:GATA zinc finger domain-containing protein 14 [Calliphora vicina]|uniref:GATA zinc finger domain-containing protein 14 n=1 Tax=Calliphora vicina TaxID=7373 RepID=UPI00325BE29D